MSFYTDCNESEVLETTPGDACPESLAQPVMAFIQKRMDGSTPNQIDITAANEHTLLATYQGLMTAVDDTKLKLIPKFGAAEMPDPEIRTQGSGNEVPAGIPFNLGEGFSSFEAILYGKRQDIVKSLKKLTGDLAVYLMDHEGQMEAITDDIDNPSYIRPVPILNFVATSKKRGTYDGVRTNKIAWNHYPNWSDDTFVFKLAFNPLQDLS